MHERLGKRAEELTQGPAEFAVKHFDSVCDSYGHDAEVRRIPGSSTDIAIFFYNDSGALAETTTPYDVFLNQYQLTGDDVEKYSFSLETWNGTIPYLKVTVIE